MTRKQNLKKKLPKRTKPRKPEPSDRVRGEPPDLHRRETFLDKMVTKHEPQRRRR